MKFKVICTIIILTLLWGCEQQKSESNQDARLFFLIGNVKVNGAPAKINQTIQNGDIVETAAESSAELALGADAGVQIRESSRVEIIRFKDVWEVLTRRGAILSLIDRGKKYQYRGPTAVAAVRGTIFYAHTYGDSSQYICTCNGTVEIHHDNSVKTVSASHHEGYTVPGSNQGNTIKPTAMKEHNDLEIFEFLYRFEQALTK